MAGATRRAAWKARNNALVPKLDLLPGEALLALAEEFEVAYTDVDGQQRLPLSEVWSVPFESCRQYVDSLPTRDSATSSAVGGPPRPAL